MGAEVVDTPFKIECCGSYNTLNQKELTSKRAHKITSLGRDGGAEAITLTCPLCRYNLDVRGKEGEAQQARHDGARTGVVRPGWAWAARQAW